MMTADRAKKRAIRERMERTGEPYSVAKRVIEAVKAAEVTRVIEKTEE